MGKSGCCVHTDTGGVLARWLVPGSAIGRGCLTLAGDALHPMTANLGQGGCIALEVLLPTLSTQYTGWPLISSGGQ